VEIVVNSAQKLIEALRDATADDRIRLQPRTYKVDRGLTVPQGVTLEGMGGVASGSPPAAVAIIEALPSVKGDLLTLRDRAVVKQLRLVDASGRVGNVVAVASTGAGTSLTASIEGCEIVNPNAPSGPLPQPPPDAPTFGAVVVFTRNAGLDGPPPPDVGAFVKLAIRRSTIRAAFRSLFAMNFASDGQVEVELTENFIEGTLDAIGGVSRPDPVSEAKTTIDSRKNVYGPPGPVGWILAGGSSPPFPSPTPGATSSNQLELNSREDKIDGFGIAIEANAGRRHPGAGPSSDNRATLRLRGLLMQTTGDKAADLILRGALSFGEFTTGDRNMLQVDIRDSTGSGPRQNKYADQEPEHGIGNDLEFVGTSDAFAASNTRIDPAPPKAFF
jgi:hypothetical protein